ncbi:MAG: hypothetical protein QM831_27515 [Kofleriaceae bacterium]
MKRALVLLVVAACGHKSSSPSAGGPATVGDQDGMWKLAPDGAMFGMVASGKGLSDLEAAYTEVVKTAQAVPMLKPYLDQMTGELQKNLGTETLTLDALGLEAKGAAIFMTPDKEGMFVLPVKDRDKFLKVAHGDKGADGIDHLGKKKDTECKVRDGLYTCVSSPKVWDLIGKGKLDISAAGARGEIEFVGKDIPVDSKTKISAAIVQQHARGTVTWRGKLMGLPLPAQFAMPAMKPRTAGDKTTGFMTMSVKSLLALIPMPDPQAEQVFKTIEDPITFTSQSSTMEIQVPLNDAAPLTALLQQCPLLGAKVNAKLVDGACEFAIPNMPQLVVDAWIDGKVLHVGQKKPAPSNAVPQDGLAKELADGQWSFAMYGRGSILSAGSMVFDQWKQMAQVAPDMENMAENLARAMLVLNEGGMGVKFDGKDATFVFGVRTMWANDEDVVQKLATLDPKTIMDGTAATQAKTFAKGPLAEDIQAGYFGLMVPTAIAGMLSAVAVPAFMDYNKRAKKSEADIMLNKIGKSAKRVFIETGALPKGDGALIPDKTCCGQGTPVNNKCVPQPELFAKDPVWSALEFSVDEPSIYRYRYHSDDGKTAVVEAIGDADCDTNEATFKLTIDTTSGNPVTTIIPPTPGVY